MRLICSLLCIFLLSSCVYYGTSHEVGNDSKSACAGGSAKDNKKCRADQKKLNEAIANKVQR